MSSPASDRNPRAQPSLSMRTPSGPVRGIVLVLHGGRARSNARARANQLAVLRMRPFANELAAAGRGDGLAVAQLRYRVRGWNGDLQSPVHDARWALRRLAERFPDVPVALVGHSMGGRTALYVADEPNVRAVVALAPWIERGDPVGPLTGRRVLIAHGDHDRLTSPKASAAYARAAAGIAASVSYVVVRAERHAMLRRAAVWHTLSTGFVLGVLFGTRPDGTDAGDATNVLTQALAGQAALVV